MEPLTEFDRQSIDTDLQQLRELIVRKQFLMSEEEDQQRKEELAAEIAQHEGTITHLKSYL